MTRFVSEAWNQEQSIENWKDIPILKSHPQLHQLQTVKEFWYLESFDKVFRTWKSKEWQQSLAPKEDIEKFYSDLCSRRIPWHEGQEKIMWGYSNLGRFNIKEAIGVMNETYRQEKEATWRKI